MIVDLREEYPGELAARDPHELAAELAARLTFAKGAKRGGGAYKSPADFQSPLLWELHGGMSTIARQRLERLKADVLGMVGGDA